MRLIDADALMEEINPKLDQLYSYEARVLLKLISDAPTIQREGLPLVIDCRTCLNKGVVNGLSQETYCEHCIHNTSWKRNYYKAAPTETELKMTNEEAFEKFILSDDWQEIRLHAQNSDELAENVWQAAISYMQEQSEPVAEVKLDYHGMKDITFNAHHWTHVLEVGDKLFTTPQRQQPLKRLDEDRIDEIFSTYTDEQGYVAIDDWYLLTNAIMDAMQEINK